MVAKACQLPGKSAKSGTRDEHACATGDVACANYLQLQMTYEQYCSVSGAPSEAFPWVTVTATVSTLSSLLAAIFIAYAVKRLMKARSAWQYREQLRLQAIIEALESTSQLRSLSSAHRPTAHAGAPHRTCCRTSRISRVPLRAPHM